MFGRLDVNSKLNEHWIGACRQNDNIVVIFGFDHCHPICKGLLAKPGDILASFRNTESQIGCNTDLRLQILNYYSLLEFLKAYHVLLS